MDLFEQMSTFVRVVETGRLGTAAKSRGLSLAAVSRQLTALERELGTSLVIRSTRQLAITEAGRRWYQYCVSTLSGLAQARADMAEGPVARGTVVVSAPMSFGIALLVEPFERLAREQPQLTVELRLQDHAVDLLGEGVDIAVRAGMTVPDSTSLIAHKLAAFRRTAVASAMYLRRRGRPKHPSELAHHELLVHTQASTSFTRWQFSKGEQQIELEPRARLKSSSPVVLREWAERGAGIALIPDWFAGQLVPVLTDWLTPEISVHAIHRAEARSTARIRVVLQALSGLIG
jgi:DNA-binding transcriptional LysR family regulator